jgi:hypothetical protein
MKPPDPTAAGTLNCTGVVPELFKFATGAIIKVAPRYQSHPILRYSLRDYLQSLPTILNDNVNQFKVGLESDKG